MYYTVKIQQTSTSETKDLFQEFGLIPTSRPVIAPPSPALKFEEVPGGSGSLDLSQALSSEISYYDRSGSLEFMLAPDSNHGGSYDYWEEVYSSLLEFITSGRVKLWTSENAWGDPVYSSYYYEGRMLINDWKTDKTWEKVTIDYRFDPFKYANDLYVSPAYTVASNGTYTTDNLAITHVTVPVITLSKPMTAVYNGREYSLPTGDSQMIAVNSSAHVITFRNDVSSGSGTVRFSFRRKFL